MKTIKEIRLENARLLKAEAGSLKSAMYTTKWQRYYNDKIRAAKRVEDNACKLSHFR